MSKRSLTINLLIACLLLSGFSSSPLEDDENIDITFTADRDELTVGEIVTLALEIRHPAGYEAVIPHLEQNWGNFEVRDQSRAETTPNPDGGETTRQTIMVTLFTPGTYQTPPLAVSIYDGAGGVIEVDVPPVTITVISVLVPGDTELRDIKPQAKLKVPFPWLWLLGGLVLASVVGGAVYWRSRRREPRDGILSSIKEIDGRLPFQVALDELARIERLDLPQQNLYKEHYTLLTECLRSYLEEQFQIRALERTTFELTRDLKRSKLSRSAVHEFIDLFQESDLVKFARFSPYIESAYRRTGQARQLVEATMPPPEILSLDETEAPE